MSGWTPERDIVRAALGHLTTVVGPISARQIVDGLIAKGRGDGLREADELIETERAADEIAHPDSTAHFNRRVGMRQAMAVVRRMCEPGPQPSRRPLVRRPADRFPSLGDVDARARRIQASAAKLCGLLGGAS